MSLSLLLSAIENTWKASRRTSSRSDWQRQAVDLPTRLRLFVGSCHRRLTSEQIGFRILHHGSPSLVPMISLWMWKAVSRCEQVNQKDPHSKEGQAEFHTEALLGLAELTVASTNPKKTFQIEEPPGLRHLIKLYDVVIGE